VHGLAIVLALAATSAAPAPDRAADTDIVINEVFYVGAAAADWVELKNTGTDTIAVGGWYFCAQFSYAQLASLPLLDGVDFVLAPGEILTVGFGLDDAASDLGLYDSFDFTNPAAMVDFLQWGTAGDPGRSDVAFLKGIWTQTAPGVYDFVPAAAAGQSAAWDGSNGGGGLVTLSADFVNGPPTRGQNNGLAPVTAASWGLTKARYRW
jgi:hypothetical protein